MTSKLTLSLLTFTLPLLTAQETDPNTRFEAITAEQRKNAANPRPSDTDKVERTFDRIDDAMEHIFGGKQGFRPVIGGMVNGAGFAAGVEYFRPQMMSGNVAFRTSARASMRRAEMFDAQVTFPHLANDRLYLDFLGVYRNLPRMNYYGPGPDSAKSGRTNYRREDLSFDFAAGFRPERRHVTLGLEGGYSKINVGPGADPRFASAERVYSPAVAPGINVQSDFVRAGPFLMIDFRDRPGDPHTGTSLYASYIYYDDRTLNTGNHRKLTAEAQQYFSFFNEKRTIALRARTELGYRNTNQVIPFYLQPTLGSSSTLRGFRPFRYYDNNMMIMNAEYRWEVMTGFGMAVFGDAGKVFHRHAQLNFTDLETDAGFGLRFASRTSVFMRWDVGFSREGFQVWITFGNVF